MESLTRYAAPWARSESRSISPKRIPPPDFRPFMGCFVNGLFGPVDLT